MPALKEWVVDEPSHGQRDKSTYVVVSFFRGQVSLEVQAFLSAYQVLVRPQWGQ
jgi:hypothetical protein